ncbi:MAG: potassium channel family protein, partial [bacterium]|nr:potassium channel family protein [bacterium]
MTKRSEVRLQAFEARAAPRLRAAWILSLALAAVDAGTRNASASVRIATAAGIGLVYAVLVSHYLRRLALAPDRRQFLRSTRFDLLATLIPPLGGTRELIISAASRYGGTRSNASLAAYEERTRTPMLAVSLAIVPIWIGEALAPEQQLWIIGPLAATHLVIAVILTVDIGARAYLSPNRRAYLASHKLDLLAVVIPPVRALKEIVGLRAVVLRRGFSRFVSFAVATVAVSALLVYALERDQEGALISSLGDAFWWATVTATTVGYGDSVPVTNAGRAIAVLLMVLGITLFSVVTAHIAAHFVERDYGQPKVDLPDDLTARLARIESTLV